MTWKTRRDQLLIGVFVAFVAVVAIAPQAVAQTVTGNIVGTIRDQQGAVVPRASVSAKNRGTGAERTAVSDASGGFSIISIPAGSYDVTASAPGFQTEIRSNVTLTVGAALRVDFTLNVGAVSEKVEVTAEAPQVDTATSTMSGLVSDTTIRELPLNGRDWLQLAVLQPGVTTVVGQQTTSLVTRGIGMKMSISGGRPDQNVFRIDGLVVNDQTNNSPGSALGVNMGVDAIREFSVLTNTYSAEYGRSSGGVINAITKSGTNTLHGSAFYFHRNSALDARNFFDVKLPPFRRNQFGGSVGGPIKKDKLFYFTNYEGLKQFLSLSLSSNTLSPNARNGKLACPASGTPPAGCPSADGTYTVTIDPRIKPYLPLYPVGNGQIAGDTQQFVLGAGQIGTENYVTGRIDYQLNADTNLAGSYTFDNATTPIPDVFNEKLETTRTRNQRIMLSLQHVFSPRILNTVRTGLNRTAAAANLDTAPTTPLLADLSLGFTPGMNMGIITVPGLDSPGGIGSSGTDIFWYTTPQLSDDLSWVKGRNNIRIGFSVEDIRDNFAGLSAPAGNWQFGSVQQFLTNVPQRFSSDFPGTDGYRGARTKLFGFYIHDDVRLRSNLTVNLGLRYEPATTLSEVNGKVANLLNLADAKPAIGNPLFKNPTLKNFAPRVGLAWDPTGTGKTAIRAGFGVFDISPTPNLVHLKFVRAAPFFEQGVLGNPPASSFPNGAFSLLGLNTLANVFVEHAPSTSYKMQWNLNIQRQLARGLSLTAGYVGSKGVHLPNNSDDADMVPPSLVKTTPDGHLQFPTTGTPQRINPNFSQIRQLMWNGYSIYHALQLNVAQQMLHGFAWQVAYAWSRSMDIGSVDYVTGELRNSMDNPWTFNPNLQRGPSDYDVPHRLSLNFVWDTPSLHSGMAVPRFLLSGWELSGIFTAQTGTPFSMRILTDRALTGSSVAGASSDGQRPDFKPGPGCASPNAVNSSTPSTYIQLQCFSFPALGQLGNLGRNALRGPNLRDFDFSLFKNHNLLGEKLRIQFRAEFFNLLNRANFGAALVTGFNAQGQPIPASASVKPSTATTSRQIQLGLKFVW